MNNERTNNVSNIVESVRNLIKDNSILDLDKAISNLELTMTWEDYYEFAKIYYEYRGNLRIYKNFKTINGYGYNNPGINLGLWIKAQKENYFRLSKEKQELLLSMGLEINKKEEKWYKKYELAKVYYEHHGYLMIPTYFKTINGYLYDAKGVNLGFWIKAQRANYGKLSLEKRELLQKIGFILKVSDNHWENMYLLARKYFEYHGNLSIPTYFKTINGYLYDAKGVNLSFWINSQRENYNGLSKERKQLLSDIGFDLEKNNDRWQNMYNLAKEYYEHHGNLNVPSGFKTINGYLYDDTGVDLSLWVNSQQKVYYGLRKEQQQLLSNIGLVLSEPKEKWESMYNLAQKYYEYHGNLNVPFNFKTVNGYLYDASGVNLFSWISFQKRGYFNLTEEQQQLLSNIGLALSESKEQWKNMYNLAKEYYEHHGDLMVPKDFKTVNGYLYDDTGVDLSFWITTQKRFYYVLSKSQQQLLNNIGFNLTREEAVWYRIYNLAQKYYEYYGNLNIPKDFKTINGYQYNDTGIDLFAWVDSQKKAYLTLTNGQQQLLNNINITLNKSDAVWYKGYSLAKKYYEHYGDLFVPGGFKTINGYQYNDDGFELGKWVEYQGLNFSKLHINKQKLLSSIGLNLTFYKNHWYRGYNLAQKYYEHYGDLFVLSGFKTINGYEYNEDGFDLDVWINSQVKHYNSANRKRVELLQSIDFHNVSVEEQWQNMYNLAQKYFEYHQNLLIPYDFKTKNGYLYDDTGVNLGNWLNIQILYYFNLTQEQHLLLQSIGFIPNHEDIKWRKYYELVKIYCDFYKNLLIPDDFKTYDGYKYSEYGFNIGAWIREQQNFYDELTEEKKELLQSIGFRFRDDALKLTRKL